MISAFKKKKSNKQRNRGVDSDRSSKDSSSLSSETSSEDASQSFPKSSVDNYQGYYPGYYHRDGHIYPQISQNLNDQSQFYCAEAFANANPSPDLELEYFPQAIHGVQPQPHTQLQYSGGRPAREVMYTKHQNQTQPYAHQMYTLHQQQMLSRRSFPNPMLSAYLGSG